MSVEDDAMRDVDRWILRTHAEFRCPTCGGSSFGSTGYPPDMMRHCHGDDAGDGAAGCRFSWPEQDDHLHFVAPDGSRFSDAAKWSSVRVFAPLKL